MAENIILYNVFLILYFLSLILILDKDVGTFGSTPILLKLNATGVMIKIQ